MLRLVLSLASLFALASSFSASPELSRRQWVEAVVVSSVVGATPLIANADVTNKVASTTALRNVKRARKQADTFEPFVVEGDYQGLRGAIRVSPMSEVRKNCFILVRGGEDGPDAEKLTETYKAFIAALEKLDSTAGLAIRGRQIPDGEIADLYKSTLVSLGDFISIAEDAVTIPLQVED